VIDDYRAYERIKPLSLTQKDSELLRIDANEFNISPDSFASKALIDSLYLRPGYEYHFAKNGILPRDSEEAYDNIKNRTADYIKNRPDLWGEEGDFIADSDILSHFSNIKTGSLETFFEPLVREIGKQSAGVATSIATTAASAPYVVPATSFAPYLTIPSLATIGIGSYFLGYQGADTAIDYLAGPDPVILPSDTWKKVTAETLGSAPFSIVPWALSSNVNLNGANILNNLYKQVEKAKPITSTGSMKNYYDLMEQYNVRPVGGGDILGTGEIAAEGALSSVKGFAGGAKSLQVNRAIENMLGTLSTTYKNNPKIMALAETAALTGAAGSAGSIEKYFPGNAFVKIPAEFAGALGTEAAVIRLLPAMKNIAQKTLQKAGGLVNRQMSTELRQLDTVVKIVKLIEAEGGDVKDIINKLESQDVQTLINQAKSLAKQRGDETTLKELEQFKPTVANIVNDPALNAVFFSISERGSKNLKDFTSEQNDIAKSALKSLINVMRLSGDPELYKLALAEERTVMYSSMLEQLQAQVNATVTAFEKVRGEGPALNKELGEKIQTDLSNFITKTTELENKLWDRVEQIDLSNTKFIYIDESGKERNSTITLASGEEIAVPNVVRTWFNLKNNKTKGILKDFNKYGSSVTADMEDLLQDFLPSDLDSNLETSVASKVSSKKIETEIKTKFGEKVKNDYNLILNAIGLRNPEVGELNLGVAGVFPSGSVPDSILNISDPAERVLEAIKLKEQRLRGRTGDKVRLKELLEVKKYASKLSQLNRNVSSVGASPEEPVTTISQLNSDTLKQMRTTILRALKEANSAVDGSKSRGWLQTLNKAILEDYSSVQGGNILYDTARNFTFAKNEVIGRTVLGDLFDVDRRGAEKIDAGSIVNKLLTGKSDIVAYRLGQIVHAGKLYKAENEALIIKNKKKGTIRTYDEASKLINDQEKEFFETNDVSVRATTNNIVRNLVYNNFDPEKIKVDGEIKNLEKLPKSLKKSDINAWREKNSGILELFPELDKDLQSAEKANNLLTSIINSTSDFNQKLKSQKVLNEIIDIENPAQTIGFAINDKNPTEQFEEIFRIFNDLDEEKILSSMKRKYTDAEINQIRNNQGLKNYINNALLSTVLEYAQEGAGGISDFSAVRLAKTLYEPIPNMIKPSSSMMIGAAPMGMPAINQNILLDSQRVKQLGGPTLMGMLVKQGIVKPDASKRYKTLLDKLAGIENAILQNELTQELIEETGAAADLGISLFGSWGARQLQNLLPGQQGSESLIIAAAGARAARRIFDKIPKNFQLDVMTEVMEDPILFANLLRQAQNKQDEKGIALGIEKILQNAGIIPTRPLPWVVREVSSEIDEEEDTSEPGFITGNVSKVSPSRLPLPPTTQGPPPEMISPSLASASPIQPIAGPNVNQNQRAKLAAAFPFDIVSDVDRMKKAGIGSLMG